MGSTNPGTRAAAIGLALIAAIGMLFATAGAAEAKGGKINACVTKSGMLEIAKSGKCPKGERKLTWSKKGKRGKAGQTGQAGAAGAQGQAGEDGQDANTAGLAQLQALVDQQGQTIAQLTQQLNALDTQVDALAPQVAALCTQLSSVTGQSDLLLTTLGALNAILDPLTLLPLPVLPSALGSFSCP